MSGPSPDLFQKLADQVAATPAVTRPEARRRNRLVLGTAFVPIVVMIGLGLVRSLDHGGARWIVASIWLLLSIVLFSLVRARASSAPIGWAHRAAFLWAPLVMIAAVLGLQALGLGEGVRGGHHLPCFSMTTALVLLPLSALFYIERKSDPVAPGLRAMLLGAAAGVMGAIPFYLDCAAPSTLEHATFGHVLPIAIAVLLGATLGRRIVALD